MRIGIVIPAYKRPEFLGRTLASLAGEHVEARFPVLVVDDGTPSDAVAAEAAAVEGVELLRIAHGGIVEAQAAGIRCLARRLSDDDAICLLAADHALPAGWASALRTGARAGLTPTCHVGQIEHTPGLRRVDSWRLAAEPLAAGLSIRRGLDCWYVVCSLPSLLALPAASMLADCIECGQVSADPRQPHRAQKTFQGFVAACLPGQRFFALLGPAIAIDHFGHATGVRPGFIRSAEHEDYYREVGRR